MLAEQAKARTAKDAKVAKPKVLCVLRALCGETYFLSPSSGLLAKWYSEYASTPNIITDSRLLFARKGIFCPQLIAPSGSQCLASITLITIPASPTIPPAAIRCRVAPPLSPERRQAESIPREGGAEGFR